MIFILRRIIVDEALVIDKAAKRQDFGTRLI